MAGSTLADKAPLALDLERSKDLLDLSMVRWKLTDPEEGKGWSEDYALQVEREYRRYLSLAHAYAGENVVPSKTVDTFWHFHILDTRAYGPDCERLFGAFMHHFPYFGMRGDADMQALQDSYASTLDLYERHFGIPPEDIWPDSEAARCPNCGRR